MGIVGVTLSISAQRLIFRSTRVEYGSEGCGVLAAGIKGGAGQSTLDVGNVVAQPTSSVIGSSSSLAGHLDSFLCSIECSYGLFGLAPLVDPVGCGLDADGLKPQVLLDRVLTRVPLDATGHAGQEDADGNYGLDQDGAHASIRFFAMRLAHPLPNAGQVGRLDMSCSR